jgi:hypothetical protein
MSPYAFATGVASLVIVAAATLIVMLSAGS